MSATCGDDELLATYVQGKLGAPQRAAVEAHISLCASCHQAVELCLDLAGDVAAEMAAEIRARRAQAAELVAELDREKSHNLVLIVTAHDKYIDVAVGADLYIKARSLYGSNFTRALDFVDASLRVAELTASIELQHAGWRLRSAILATTGRIRDAWDAIERVEAMAPLCPDPQLATASTFYAKAWVAAQRDEARWDEALAWLDVAMQTFARRDVARVNDALWLRATVFFRRRDYSSALQLFELLWRRSQSTELAIATGGCAVKSGNAERASEMYAYVEGRELTPLLATQIICLRGELSVLRGEYAAGVRDLTTSAEAYRNLGMEDAAIHTDLLRVRAMMEDAPDSAAANRSAADLLRSIIAASTTLDRREPSRRRRLTTEATVYLRELAVRESLTLDVVRHVEAYVFDISNGRPRPFIAPIPHLLM